LPTTPKPIDSQAREGLKNLIDFIGCTAMVSWRRHEFSNDWGCHSGDVLKKILQTRSEPPDAARLIGKGGHRIAASLRSRTG
jgi:hypothetical protein